MSMEPPPFEEASRCNVCKCSFTTFRRRHHCRCCGRTFCAEHSSIQMDLPQFGILSDVRVCAQCFNNASRSKKDDPPAFSNGVNAVTDSVSRLDINVVADTKSAPTAEKLPVPVILECKCRMPLCICEAPAPPSDSVSLQVKTTSIPTVQSNPKPKKADPSPKSRGSTSNSKSSTIFNLGQAPNNSLDRTSTDYDISGEGLRGAIKNGDTASAKKLLSLGVEANYCDKQGSSLLHLAAVFNRTEIAFALMDHGASMDCKNLQGETPLDCAPVTLQYRMKKKMEESVHVVP